MMTVVLPLGNETKAMSDHQREAYLLAVRHNINHTVPRGIDFFITHDF
jgi:hypothetical protein